MKLLWDPEKDRLNRRKHGVSFEEAGTVFGDPLALSWNDVEHSALEYRYLTLGYTDKHRLVVVSHTERTDGLRIISARLATATERRLYESA